MTEVSTATAPTRLTARALIVGERIDTGGLERPDMISLLPLAFRVGERGMAALFRFGVAVMVGLSPLEEEDLLAKLRSRVSGARARGDDETAVLEIAPDIDEQKSSGGAIQIKNLSPPRFLVIADALAKTVALARDEREVNAVFDVIEPFAAKLAATGRPPFRRRAMLNSSGRRCSPSIGCRAESRSRRSRTFCGTTPSLSAFMPASRTNMSCMSGPTCSSASWR